MANKTRKIECDNCGETIDTGCYKGMPAVISGIVTWLPATKQNPKIEIAFDEIGDGHINIVIGESESDVLGKPANTIGSYHFCRTCVRTLHDDIGEFLGNTLV